MAIGIKTVISPPIIANPANKVFPSNISIPRPTNI